jgi:hypothetical protein
MKSVGEKSRPCPKCRSTRTQRLPHVSSSGTSDHYRCNACGNIWSEPRTPKTARLRI